jgi:L-fuconate dehydratase
VVERARYRVPTASGYSSEMKRASIDRHRFPDGPEWSGAA